MLKGNLRFLSSAFLRQSSLIISPINSTRMTLKMTRAASFTADSPPSSLLTKTRVAVAQMTSTSNLKENFQVCKSLIKKASQEGATLVSLPECFSFIGSREGESLSIAQPLDGPILHQYLQLAKEYNIWLSLGGFQESGPTSSHLYNSHVLVNENGEIVSVYRKIHLFDVDVPGGPVLKESNSTAPGSELITVESPVGRMGLSICYDLRFPQLFQRLRFVDGAEILSIPSAFTKKTGEAHWEVLLKARAIECQCYVLAAAQAGIHNEKRESYGHALIIDPWGSVVAKMEDPLATGIIIADIDLDKLHSIRQQIPISEHRRYDLYGESLPRNSSL